MSKLKQIEAALVALDPATFQELGDTYFRRNGYPTITPYGLTLGTAKTARGTPDSFARLPDGRYVFFEYATQPGQLAAKFADDVRKDLDAQKTGVPVERIAEIILCHTGKLSPGEDLKLADQSASRGVMLRTVGLGRLAHALSGDDAQVARDILHIEVDSGQILSTEDFVAAYNHGRLATPLNTGFHFREKEIEDVLAALQNSSVVLMSGRPGVGKSRLALECAQRYVDAQPETEVRCVFDLASDILSDLQVAFRNPGHYLIIVDDANRISRFEYVLNLLRDGRDDRTIKIIATVRDYALSSISGIAQEFGAGTPIRIGELRGEELRTLVRDEFDINDSAYLMRISDVAQGNARIAVMAAMTAVGGGPLQSLTDVSAIYDGYFRSVREDLEELDDKSLLQTVAIVVLFRRVDRSNAELMATIENAFGVGAEAFWADVVRLHDLEIVDIYNDEVVRISDQVLATYLFFLAAFRVRAINLDVFLTELFPRFHYRVVDALFPVWSAFNGVDLAEAMRPRVVRARQVLQERGDDLSVMHLLEEFGFLTPADTLLAMQERIDGLVPGAMGDEIPSFVECKDALPSPSILGVLARFGAHAEQVSRMAVELIVEYLRRRPQEAPHVVHALNEGWGIDLYAVRCGYPVQRLATDLLGTYANGTVEMGADPLVGRLLLAYARAQLQVRFHRADSGRGNSITIMDFTLQATDGLIALRQKLWEQAFALFATPSLRDGVLGLIQSCSGGVLRTETRDIMIADSAIVLHFMHSCLNPQSLEECAVVHDYLAMLDDLDISYDRELKVRFTNDAMTISELLSVDWSDRSELGWKQYNAGREARLSEYADKLDGRQLRVFLTRAAEVRSIRARGPRTYELDSAVVQILLNVSRRAPELFADVLVEHLHQGNLLELRPSRLVDELIHSVGPTEAYDRLVGGDYLGRRTWLSGFFVALPLEMIGARQLKDLYALYAVDVSLGLVHDLSFLTKFTLLDPQIVVRITRLLVDHATADLEFGRILETLFDTHSPLWPTLPDLFAGNIDLLELAYFAACKVGSSSGVDYNGSAFGVLLTMDPEFAAKWIASMTEQKDWMSRHDDSRCYAFLWRRADAERVITQLIDAMLRNTSAHFGMDDYADVFFRFVEGTPGVPEIEARQDRFLDSLIKAHNSNEHRMGFLFNIISRFTPERRRARLATFLAHNNQFEAFDRLALLGTMRQRSSAVRSYQIDMEYLESLLPLFSAVKLLRHRQSIERYIQSLREQMSEAQKRDFMDD